MEEESDMPGSWVSEIVIPLDDLQRRCPEGKKTILYKQAKYEIFAEYKMQDGMVSRLTEYADSARKLNFVLNIRGIQIKL